MLREHPQVHQAIEDLDACRSRAEWDMALGRLVAVLVATIGITGPKGNTALLIELQCRIEAGPPMLAKNRPRASLEAILDARRLDSYRAAGAVIRSPAEAAKLLREMLGLKLSYQAAIKRAGRAIDRGGFAVAGPGRRFGRPSVPK